MEENDDFQIQSFKLMKALGITHELERLYMGHIQVLGDNHLIECDDKKHPYGFKIKTNNYCINNANYRITARGYEFLDMLKQDTVFNKIKNFTVSNAFDIGKQMLIALATGGIG